MIKRLSLIAFICIASIQMMSAQAGMRLYGGLSAQTNESEILNPDGFTSGYHVGADLRLNEGNMFFLLGGRFTNVKYTNNEALYTGENPDLQMINTRVGLGFKLFKISEAIVLRAKFLGSIDYVFNTPIKSSEAGPGFENYKNINSVASLIGGLGVTFGPFLVDVEYGYGLFNIVSKQKDTVPTAVSLSVGTFF